MATKTEGKLAASHGRPQATAKTTAIASQAMQAWNRIPSNTKIEIIRAVEKVPSIRDGSLKTVKVGKQTLMVRKMSSGFRVLYEQGDDSNTIVSVLTPREADMAKG